MGLGRDAIPWFERRSDMRLALKATRPGIYPCVLRVCWLRDVYSISTSLNTKVLQCRRCTGANRIVAPARTTAESPLNDLSNPPGRRHVGL